MESGRNEFWARAGEGKSVRSVNFHLLLVFAPSAPVVPRVVPLVADAEGNSIRVNPDISASTNTSCHVMQEIFPVVVVCGVFPGLDSPSPCLWCVH